MSRALAMIVCWTAAAAAQPVAVDADACVGEATAIGRQLELELDTRGRAADSAAVQLRCVGDAIVIAVDDRLTNKRVERRLPPGARPDPRALALATAELVRASWLEIAHPRRASTRRWALGAATHVQAIGDFQSFGVGGTVRRALGSALISGDAVVETAGRQMPVGDVTAKSASIAARAGLHARAGALSFAVGAGVRVGVVSLRGQPGRLERQFLVGRRVAGAWGGPIAVAEIHSGDRLRIGLIGEAGYAVTSTRGTVLMDSAVVWGRTFYATRANLEVSW